MSAPITLDELDHMADVMRLEGTASEGRWSAYANRRLALPDWFDTKLDPGSEEYRAQQHRLWQAVSGRASAYEPLQHEQTPEIADCDSLRSPAFYARRDPGAVDSAGDHLIALGNMVKLSGLRPGDVAIEYGAGFGQIALTLARLGVEVDTVDINSMFNDAIRTQAAFHGVKLRAVQGNFGDNPRPGSRYNAVLFYESFHHCADPAALVGKLRDLIAPNGVVLLAGEPIGEGVVPYPWGLRLDAEAIAVIRWRGWLELGFHEDYLVRLFIAAGFVWTKFPCALTYYGEVHAFRPRPERINLVSYGIPAAERLGWHMPEREGRWTTGPARLPLDTGARHTHIRVALANYHGQAVRCTLRCGESHIEVRLASLDQLLVTTPCPAGTPMLEIAAEPIQTAPSADGRRLGVFVRSFEYLTLEPTAAAEVMRIVRIAGQPVHVTGDPADAYFDNAMAHADDLMDLSRRVTTLPDGAVVLDVGANIGLSAIAIAMAQPQVRVIAFEPNPVTYGHLCRNVAAFPNIETVQAAVSNRAGTLRFHPATYGPGSHVVGSDHLGVATPTIEVDALALDSFVSEHGLRPSFIKLNIEGHEPEALAGATKTIMQFRPAIYMEFNAWTLNAFAGHVPAVFARAIWDSFDVEGYDSPLAFLYENFNEKACVSKIFMTPKPGVSLPSLEEMSFPSAARAHSAGH
jgi:FkbM family methyltransferase